MSLRKLRVCSIRGGLNKLPHGEWLKKTDILAVSATWHTEQAFAFGTDSQCKRGPKVVYLFVEMLSKIKFSFNLCLLSRKMRVIEFESQAIRIKVIIESISRLIHPEQSCPIRYDSA